MKYQKKLMQSLPHRLIITQSTTSEQSSNAVFKSGIAFGVAAAALIAAIQEFVKSGTDDKRHTRRKPVYGWPGFPRD
jgi:hypothetical protein